MSKIDDDDPLVAMEIGRTVISFSRVESNLRWVTQLLIAGGKPEIDDLFLSNQTAWSNLEVFISQTGNREIEVSK